MAVEIKEVIIRAVLDDEDSGADDKATEMETSSSAGTDPNELIEMCVEQVLRILRRQNYR